MTPTRIALLIAPGAIMVMVVILLTGIEQWTAGFGTTPDARLAMGRVGIALPYVVAASIGIIFLFAAKGTAAIRFAGAGVLLATVIVAPNLLDQDFTCDGPDQKWGTDASYVWTAEGWLYLAIVVDLYSRRIVGWDARDRRKKDLAISALHKAIAIRRPKPGLIQHSDRGSQYASYDYRKLLGLSRL